MPHLRRAPDWPVPVRQSLGDILLAAKRPADAEVVYRQLKRFPGERIIKLGTPDSAQRSGRMRKRPRWAHALQDGVGEKADSRDVNKAATLADV